MQNTNTSNGWRLLSKNRVLLFLTILTVAVGGVLFFKPVQQDVEASNPSAGTIAATDGAIVSWVGDKSGAPPAANGEPSCSDGTANSTNCDSFTLTVSPGNWSNKQIKVTIAVNNLDYDLVVRREITERPVYRATASVRI